MKDERIHQKNRCRERREKTGADSFAAQSNRWIFCSVDARTAKIIPPPSVLIRHTERAPLPFYMEQYKAIAGNIYIYIYMEKIEHRDLHASSQSER